MDHNSKDLAHLNMRVLGDGKQLPIEDEAASSPMKLMQAHKWIKSSYDMDWRWARS